jgi:uncharacterized protein (UPF0147 family)
MQWYRPLSLPINPGKIPRNIRMVMQSPKIPRKKKISQKTKRIPRNIRMVMQSPQEQLPVSR